MKGIESVYAAKQQGISSFEEAIEIFGLNFQVDRVPLYTNKGGLKNINIAEAIIRTDNKDCLGIVSKKYPVISPVEKFQALKEYSDKGIIEYVDGGMFGKNSAKCFLSARIKDSEDMNAGKGDIIEKRVIFYSSWDGSKGNEFVIAPYRLICNNGLAIPEKELSVSFKNSKNSGTQFLSMPDKIKTILDHYKIVEDFLLEAQKVNVTEQEMNNFVKRVMEIPVNQNVSDMPTRTMNRYNSIIETIHNGIGQEEIQGLNVYKILNGITCYVNNVEAVKKDDQIDYVYFGTGNKMNEAAYNLSHELVYAN